MVSRSGKQPADEALPGRVDPFRGPNLVNSAGKRSDHPTQRQLGREPPARPTQEQGAQRSETGARPKPSARPE
jgi:hypothetical protein